MTLRIRSSNIEASTLANLAQVKISTITVTDSSYNNLDDLAVDTSGGYIKITGSGFASGCTVLVGTQTASAVSFVNSTEVRAQIPAQTAGTYPVYLVNPDGATAIRVNAINYSGVPAWTTASTLPDQQDGTAISIQFSANSAITYSLAVGSTLPAGLTLSNVGLLSGTVSGLTVDTTYNFTVVATDAELQDTPRAFSVTVTSGDQYLNRTSVLLQSDVTTFVSDASTNAFPITVVGDTRPNNFGPYTPGYYSVYFDGTGDSLTVAASSAFVMGLDNFTIEGWCYQTGKTQNYPRMIHFGPYWQNDDAWGIIPRDADYPTKITFLSFKLGGRLLISSSDFELNRWNHVVVTRDAGVFRLFVNGKLEAVNSSLINSTIESSATNTVAIGSATTTSGGEDFLGYISNVRILKGSVVTEYQTSSTTVGSTIFNTPSIPLTNISGTSLLACQSNRFVDTSANNFAITRNGTTTISGFDPFLPSSEFSGRGSGYFDGTGDYLYAGQNSAYAFGTGDFTVEFWVYTTSSTTQMIFDTIQPGISGGGSDRFYVLINSNQTISSGPATNVQTSSNAIILGAWNHVAVVRSGTTRTIYINGVSGGTGTLTNNLTSNYATIGLDAAAGGSVIVNGYISNFRVVKGTAIYTSNFTPPTSPVTAVANTSLLTLQTNQPNTNGVFLDSSTNNFLPTRAGDAAQSSFSPYGANWSNYFDGNGDYLDIINSSTCANFGTSDFTIEGWFYFNSLSLSILADFRSSPSDVAGSLYNNGSSVAWYVSGADRIIGGTLVINTWNHIAVCRSSGSTRLFLNGTQVGSTYSDSNNYVGNTNRPRLGFLGDGTGSLPFTGYMSNLRILKGTALYTSTFTPPTSPLAAIANTSVLTCADNRFVDDSANNFVITRTGDVRVERFGPFPATTVAPRYSVYFDGTGDYISAAVTTTSTSLGTSDCTLEAWVYLSALSGTQCVFSTLPVTAAATYTGYAILINSSGYITVDSWNPNNQTLTTTNNPLVAKQWYHIAFTRNSGTNRIFVNGVQCTTTGTMTQGLDNVQTALTIGYQLVTGYNFPVTGYISNFRIVKGTAVYTSNFTSPTAPLSAITNTSLLACQSATLIDSSANNFTLTAAGDVRPATFAPFNPVFTNKQPYTPATYGGSVFVDGNGDYINLTSQSLLNLGTVNFTLECWFYDTGSSLSYPTLIGTVTGWTTGSFSLRYNNTGQAGKVTVHWNPAGDPFLASSSTFPSRCWHHVALTRSGNTFTLYVNGTLQATGTSSNAFNLSFGGTNVGWSAWDGGAGYFQGYIADVRLLSGTVLYPSAFVPPVAPLTAITQTVLLYNNAASSTVDNTGSHIVRHVGNAQTSTTIKKYGTGSMYFDGSGDYVSIPNHPAFLFGSGDYTIEAWIYPTALTGYPCIAGIWSTVSPGKQAWMLFFDFNGSMAFFIDPDDTLILSAPNGTIQANVWQHVAVTKSGTAFRMFKDGILVASATQSHTMQNGSGALEIGDVSDGGTHDYTGYIDDLRITKGYARYTANFTPPGLLPAK